VCKLFLRLGACLPIILLTGIIYLTGCSKSSSDEQPQVELPKSYPSVKLPDKFVCVFLGVEPIAGSEQLNYIQSSVAKAKEYNINVICLVVNWRSVQPTELTYDFNSLHDMVVAIKSQGCQCILRIYANAGSTFKAWPDWLNPVDTYNSTSDGKSVLNPLPWDETYRDKYYSFVSKIVTLFMDKDEAFPDALQIVVGGDYGEQVLNGYTSSESDSDFLNKLYTAQEEHITKHITAWNPSISDYIVMVNSLDPGEISVDTRVGNFAINKGVRFIQSNAGAYNLQNASYGQDNITLLKSFSGTYKRILEDTDSTISVQNRLEILKQVESANSIGFDGVIISIDDLTSSNASGIANLRAHLGL